MAEKELTIRLRPDQGDASALAQQAKAELNDLVTAAERAAEKQEKAFCDAYLAEAQAAREAGAVVKKAMADSSVAADGYSLSLRKVAAQQVSLGAVAQVHRTIVESMADGGHKGAELARDVTRMRDTLRGITSMRGSSEGGTTALLRKHADSEVATGVRTKESIDSRKAFSGAGESSKGRKFDEAYDDESSKQIGQFAIAQGTRTQPVADLGDGALRFKDHRGEGGSGRALGDVVAASGRPERGKGDMPTLIRRLTKSNADFVDEDESRGRFANIGESAPASSVAGSSEVAMSLARLIKGSDQEWGGGLKTAGIARPLFKASDAARAKGLTASSGGIWDPAETGEALAAFDEIKSDLKKRGGDALGAQAIWFQGSWTGLDEPGPLGRRFDGGAAAMGGETLASSSAASEQAELNRKMLGELQKQTTIMCAQSGPLPTVVPGGGHNGPSRE